MSSFNHCKVEKELSTIIEELGLDFRTYKNENGTRSLNSEKIKYACIAAVGKNADRDKYFSDDGIFRRYHMFYFGDSPRDLNLKGKALRKVQILTVVFEDGIAEPSVPEFSFYSAGASADEYLDGAVFRSMRERFPTFSDVGAFESKLLEAIFRCPCVSCTEKCDDWVAPCDDEGVLEVVSSSQNLLAVLHSIKEAKKVTE